MTERLSPLCLFSVIVVCTGISWVICDHADFLVSSDTLLPAAFTWDVLHHSDAWSAFQQARVPSIFPDLVVLGLLQVISHSWRIAMAAWVFLSFVWLIWLASWLIAQLTRCKLEAAVWAFLLVLVPLLTVACLGMFQSEFDATPDSLFLPYLFLIRPLFHGGPFLWALSTAVFAGLALRRPSLAKLICLALLVAAATLSDLLAVSSLLAPLSVALIAGLWVGTQQRRIVVHQLLAIWGGAALGIVGAQFLFRAASLVPRLRALPIAMLRVLLELGHRPELALLVIGLPVILFIDANRRGWRAWCGQFWLVFGAASVAASIALLPLEFEDLWSFRYVQPLLWWGAILLAALVAATCERRGIVLRRPVALLALALAAIYPALHPRVPTLFVWRSPLAACLRAAGLQDGLADYWVARRTSAATDWDIHIEQIDSHGAARLWDNDQNWFAWDIHDPSQPASYGYVVMDDLEPDRILAVYGPPDRRLTCGSSTVWVYAGAQQMLQSLRRASAAIGYSLPEPAAR